MSLETDIRLLKKDMAELTKSYYKVLKRNVELYDKLTNLEEDIFDLRRTSTSQSNDSKGVERE